MHKKLSSLIVLLVLGVCVNNVKGQVNPKFGIRGGINFASFTGDQLGDESSRIGLLAGFYGVIPISGTAFSIQPEVLYTQKGAEVNIVKINLSYIQVPIFARLDFANESFLSPHLLLGPYLAFNINAEYPEASKPNAEDEFKNVLFGLAIGAGVDINKISIGVRYSQGIDNANEGISGRNQVISIVAGYQF